MSGQGTPFGDGCGCSDMALRFGIGSALVAGLLALGWRRYRRTIDVA